MSVFTQVLRWGPVFNTRRNHALEHATLQVLAEKNSQLRAAGYSDPNGFWLLGNLETSDVQAAVEQAVARMRAGEHGLAVHPHCGTNLVTTGFLAGSFAWLGMMGASKSMRDKLERWPLVVTLVTMAVFIAQPLGPFIQAKVTTSPEAGSVRTISIERSQRGDMPVHRVLTRY